MDFKRYLVWFILAVVSLLSLVMGVNVLRLAFAQTSPQIMVMLIFSGSLIFILGLVGFIALYFKIRPVEKIEEEDN